MHKQPCFSRILLPQIFFATQPVILINIDPQNKPSNKSQNTRRWHQQIGAIDTHRGAEEISASSDPLKMTFTNRKSDATGFGVLEVTNADPLSFAATARYTDLTLGNINDYFDVNEGVAVVTTQDQKYGFVTGFNGSFFGSKVESIDGVQAGSNIGIIKNPLGPNPQLIAATRPIPMGFATDLVLSNDDKYLYATYSLGGGVYIFDVEEIIQTLEHPGNYIIDQFGRSSSSSFFDPAYQRSANMFDFAGVPIDDINPNISIAADYGITNEDRARNQFEYGVFEGSNRHPVGTGITRNLAVSPPDLVNLLAPNHTPQTDLTPTFTWDFLVPDEQIKEVNLFVSTFGEDEGLLPWDRVVDLSDQSLLPSLSLQQKRELLSDPWHGYDDFNPGRILTATWKRDTDTWYWHDGTTPIAQAVGAPANIGTSFTLPGGRTLTAGQQYYWGVQAISDTGKSTTETGEFQTIAPPSTSPFSSVTVLTHGFTLLPTSTGVPDTFFDLADKIVSVESALPSEKGLILLYNKPTGLWVPVDKNAQVLTDVTGGLNPGDTNYLSTLARNIQSNYVNQNKPLVLLPEWSTQAESIMPDSGFTEAAADTFFASLVQLDQALGGNVGQHDGSGNLVRLYNDQGDLIRTHGALFNSPLHFIGYSRGAVVNSEIIQRLGTYFPYSGGALNPDGTGVVNAQGQRVRDLQMTTIDPHDFYQESLKVDGIIPGTTIFRDFRDFNEPTVQVWDNVTFADNYYQTLANPNGRTWTPNGRAIEGADVNIRLDRRTGFTEDSPLNPLDSPHIKIFTWYAGTLDLGLDEASSGYEPQRVANPVYDLPGEAAVNQLFDSTSASTTLTPWYSSGGNIASTEGIGTGWFYSKLGGGNRTTVDLSRRVSVDFDNTDEDIAQGDFAIPTVFNGNFDVGLSDDPNAPVPGWSFHNGEQPLLRKYLVDKASIPTLVEPEIIDDPNLDDNAGNNTAPLMAALSVETRKNSDLTLKLGDGNPTDFYPNVKFVPDWGVLRFYLHAPDINATYKGSLNITVTPLASSVPSFTQTITLQQAENLKTAADGMPLTYLTDKYKIDYGKRGFEPFYIDLPSDLRGTPIIIKFDLNANIPVYIDNIGFKSTSLKFGNPTNARTDLASDQYVTNYLIEKPQYTLSYNSQTNTPNWVSWELNKSWVNGNAKGREANNFAEDTDLPASTFYRVTNDDYKSFNSQINAYTQNQYNAFSLNQNQSDSIFYNSFDGAKAFFWSAPGHLTASADRQRSVKDNLATFLTTNLLPQDAKQNGGIWQAQEGLLQDLADQGYRFSIYAGGYGQGGGTVEVGYPLPKTVRQKIGNKIVEDPLIKTGDPDPNQFASFSAETDSSKNIQVPSALWKVVLGFSPTNESKYPDIHFAWWIPNNSYSIKETLDYAYPRYDEKKNLWIPQFENRAKEDNLFKISIQSLENRLNKNLPEESKYDFLRHLRNSDPKKNEIKRNNTGNTYFSPASSLLAELDSSQADLFSSTISTNTTIGHDSLLETAFSELNSGSLLFQTKVGSSKVRPNQISFLESNIIQFSATESGIGEIGTDKSQSADSGIVQLDPTHIGAEKISPRQPSSRQVGSTEISHLENRSEKTSFAQNSIAQIPFGEVAVTKVNSGQVSPTHNNSIQPISQPNNITISQNNTTQIQSLELSGFPSQTISTSLNNDFTKVSFPSLIPSNQVFKQNLSSFAHNTSATKIDTIFNSLPLIWNSVFDSTNTLAIDFVVKDLPVGQLAEAQITLFDEQGRPIGGNILIDPDANGKGWFIDTTPFDNSEFNTALSDTAYRAAADSAAFGHYDLLTALLHEMGHLAGFIDGYKGFDSQVQSVNGSRIFVTRDGISAKLSGDHLDPKLYPYDLLNPVLAPSVRKLPSLLDLQLLSAIRTQAGMQGNIGENAALNAPLTSAPLLTHILNGTFDDNNTTSPDYGWSTRGGSAIINGQAVLSEDSRFNSNFSQSIVIPEGAKYLQFTLLDTQLGTSTKFNPADAFEVALLDANTFAPLAGTATGLTQTDALLNIQHDGTAYLSPFVKLRGSAIANNTLTLDSPLTFTVDVSSIAPGTQAKLYFDLLGFGEVNAKIILDNVRLLTLDVVAPTANDDTFIAQEATPLTLNILSNDSDIDGTIDPTTLTISANPNNGSIFVNTDGTIIYTPNHNFIGTDSFTYTVLDDSGETSNRATVTIAVNNVLPTINNVLVSAGIIEGNKATFTAIATDPGSNELTYTWNFGDGTSPVFGQEVNHIYADDGDYTAW